MGKSQRTKGASYEREVCAAFSAALSRDVKRNIGQARDGGNDIDVPPLVIECKRRKTLTTIGKWMEQARAACVGRPRSSVPIVVCREDNGESLVVISLKHFLPLLGDGLASLDEQLRLAL